MSHFLPRNLCRAEIRTTHTPPCVTPARWPPSASVMSPLCREALGDVAATAFSRGPLRPTCPSCGLPGTLALPASPLQSPARRAGPQGPPASQLAPPGPTGLRGSGCSSPRVDLPRHKCTAAGPSAGALTRHRAPAPGCSCCGPPACHPHSQAPPGCSQGLPSSPQPAATSSSVSSRCCCRPRSRRPAAQGGGPWRPHSRTSQRGQNAHSDRGVTWPGHRGHPRVTVAPEGPLSFPRVLGLVSFSSCRDAQPCTY